MPLMIVPESHRDHVHLAIVEHVQQLFEGRTNPEKGVVIEAIELPGHLHVVSGLWGPAAGDPPVEEASVHYRPRGGRSWASRLVDRPFRWTNRLTIVAGPFEGHDLVLYTCYGGPPAPRELGDPKLMGWERDEAAGFWRQHALADEEGR